MHSDHRQCAILGYGVGWRLRGHRLTPQLLDGSYLRERVVEAASDLQAKHIVIVSPGLDTDGNRPGWAVTGETVLLFHEIRRKFGTYRHRDNRAIWPSFPFYHDRRIQHQEWFYGIAHNKFSACDVDELRNFWKH